MNRLAFPSQVRVISLLTEGNSIRATERLTGVHRDTIIRLSKRVGEACHRLHHAAMRNLHVGFLELDETWGFIRKKQQHLQDGDPAEFGDAYLWMGLDAQTKLIVSYLVGKRTGENARALLADLRGRVINRPQITTDAFHVYEEAVVATFGGDVDYVMMNKKAGTYPIRRGQPDMDQVTTNHVERCNLNVRTGMRRHTRRTSGHSKKLDYHRAAVSLTIAHYNWVRIHEALCVTPAMEYGLTDHVWGIPELIREAEATPPELEPLPSPPPFPRPGRRPFQLRVIRGGKVG